MKRRSSATCLGERCVSPLIKRTKVQAQRKFAQGSNTYVASSTKIPKSIENSSQVLSPEQESVPEPDERELNNFSNLPTIDDFLTFLCYRETDVLPTRLSYLNTPQFEDEPVRKKKSAISLPNKSSNERNKASDKINSNFKTTTKPVEQLRKDIKCKPIISKPSRSLALKHNQRLRKTVQSKFAETKLQTLKSKNSQKFVAPKYIVNAPPSQTSDNESSCRTNTKFKPKIRYSSTREPMSPINDETRRVTRRNSNLDKVQGKSINHFERLNLKNSLPSEKSIAHDSPAKSLRARSISSFTKDVSINVENARVPSKKPSTKSLRISIPKYKLPISSPTKQLPSKPVTRSTRSSPALFDSKPKTISSRPSRRTKEAAALYMEMLGRELLCPDESGEDDDNMSIDSFPELPNTEQHIRREKEIKEMAQKTKNKPSKTVGGKLKSKLECGTENVPIKLHRENAKNRAKKDDELEKKKTESKRNNVDSEIDKKIKKDSTERGKSSTKEVDDAKKKNTVNSDTDSKKKKCDREIDKVEKEVKVARKTSGENKNKEVDKSKKMENGEKMNRVGKFGKKNATADVVQKKKSLDDEKNEAVDKIKENGHSKVHKEVKPVKEVPQKIKSNDKKEDVAQKEKHVKEMLPKNKSETKVNCNKSDNKVISNKPGSKVSSNKTETKINSEKSEMKSNSNKPETKILFNKSDTKISSKKPDTKVINLNKLETLVNSDKSETKINSNKSETKVDPSRPKPSENVKEKVNISTKPQNQDSEDDEQETDEVQPKETNSKKGKPIPNKVPAKRKHIRAVSDSDSEEDVTEKPVKDTARKIEKVKCELKSRAGKLCQTSNKSMKKVKNDKSQIQKLSNELKKLVEDKPLKDRLNNIKSIEEDEMLIDLESFESIVEKLNQSQRKQSFKQTQTPTILSPEDALKEVEQGIQLVEKKVAEMENAEIGKISKDEELKATDKVNDQRISQSNIEDEKDEKPKCQIKADDHTLKEEKSKKKISAVSRIKELVKKTQVCKKSMKVVRAKANDKEESVKQVSTSEECEATGVSVSEDNKKFSASDESECESLKSDTARLVFAKGNSETESGSNKMFCLESKKIIFKKNKSSSVVETEDSSKKTEAFSADNENSVYAFEPDLPTTSPPFRRLKPVTPTKNLLSGSSIAVQVNFESNTKIECASSSETQVSSTTDCGDRVFYIPINTSDTSSTLGVAVKLDTDGANQKIIMSATLVTKSPSYTTATATTVASKSNTTEPISSPPPVKSVKEQVPKKVISSKENVDKVVATADSQTSQSNDSPSSTVISPKPNKKVSSAPKSNQSVKIVKINAPKKNATMKTKSKVVKDKNLKNSTETLKPTSSVDSSEDILEAPTFYPSEAEFNDPLEYIETIRSVAEKYGVCRIVPPSTFRPECKVSDQMRFTAYNQYVHKMLHRWGPNVKEMMAIKKFLTTQDIEYANPLIGGMEVDLPKLYHIVQQCGGLNAVIEKERWQQVADVMKIPKFAQDRIAKLDDIYCKYLLPYDVLSHNEREKLFEDIEKEWNKHLKDPNHEDDEVFEDIDECIVKGKTMPLSCFYRIARNTMMMCFGNSEGQQGESTETIEKEFWDHVSKRKCHICVHSGSIDTGMHGYGFSVAKNSTFRKHPWNLKVLTNNSASLLRSLGPIIGVTVPTLHVGMLYSACCWYRDPHGLPWIEYLHTGANKIWYGIPDEFSEQFKKAMFLLVPQYCRDKKLWLPSDTVVIPPPLLTAQNVPLSRVIQQPGQFVVVFPKAFTSCLSTGYMVSESVYFAHTSWLSSSKQIFSDMQESCEPSVFSLEQLLISVATDVRANLSMLIEVLPLLLELKESEVTLRAQLEKLGLSTSEKLQINKKRKSKASFNDEDNYECEICRANLFVSLVINSHEQTNYCLKHAINLVQKKPAQVKYCKLMYAYTDEELEEVIQKVRQRIETKKNRKSHTKNTNS